jgi:hypothetical protein
MTVFTRALLATLYMFWVTVALASGTRVSRVELSGCDRTFTLHDVELTYFPAFGIPTDEGIYLLVDGVKTFIPWSDIASIALNDTEDVPPHWLVTLKSGQNWPDEGLRRLTQTVGTLSVFGQNSYRGINSYSKSPVDLVSDSPSCAFLSLRLSHD